MIYYNILDSIDFPEMPESSEQGRVDARTLENSTKLFLVLQSWLVKSYSGEEAIPACRVTHREVSPLRTGEAVAALHEV